MSASWLVVTGKVMTIAGYFISLCTPGHRSVRGAESCRHLSVMQSVDNFFTSSDGYDRVELPASRDHLGVAHELGKGAKVSIACVEMRPSVK